MRGPPSPDILPSHFLVISECHLGMGICLPRSKPLTGAIRRVTSSISPGGRRMQGFPIPHPKFHRAPVNVDRIRR